MIECLLRIKLFLPLTNYQLQLSEKRFLYLGLKGGGFYNDIDINGLGRIFDEFNPALSLVKSYFTPVIG